MKLTFARIASRWLIAAFFIAVMASTQPLRAEYVCQVPANYGDLQSAINDPNCWNILVGPGTYVGNFNISRNVQIIGAGIGKTVVYGNGGTAFNINSGNVHLEGMTIEKSGTAINANAKSGVFDVTVVNCFLTGNSGGISVVGAILTVADSTIDSSWSDGIDILSGSLSLIRSSITNSVSFGLSLMNAGATITESTLAFNSSAAISTDSDLQISSSTIAGNGMAIMASGNVSLKSSIIYNNANGCLQNGGSLNDGGENFRFPSNAPADCPGSYQDAQLTVMTNNLGARGAYMLPNPNSPVIGKGSCTDASGTGLGIDQLYRPRPTSGCDAGSVDTHATVDAHPDALWWRLNEGAGIWASDSSPHGLTGNVNSTGVPAWLNGSGAMALFASTGSLQSGNTWVSTSSAAIPSQTAATVSLWYNCNQCGGRTNDMVPFYLGSNANYGYGLQVRHSDNHVLFVTGAFGTIYTFDFGWAMPEDGSWNHLALVQNAPNWQLYVNGKLQGSVAVTVWNSSTGVISLGADTSGDHNFGGLLSDFRVYSRSLSAAELNLLATADGTAPLPGTYSIQNVNSGLVLAVSGGGSTSEGAAIIQWDNYGHPDQEWTIARPVVPGAPGYTITDVNSGMVVGVAGASLTAMTPLIQWASNGSTDQVWEFSRNGSNWTITDVKSGMVMDISAASTSPGAQAVQFMGFPYLLTSQNWMLTPVQ